MDVNRLVVVLAAISAASLATIALNSVRERHMFGECISSTSKGYLDATNIDVQRVYSYAYSRCMGGRSNDY